MTESSKGPAETNVYPFSTAHHLFGESGFENASAALGETYILRLFHPADSVEYLYAVPGIRIGSNLVVDWQLAAFAAESPKPAPEQIETEARLRVTLLREQLQKHRLQETSSTESE
ncbi:hypothetical protein F4V43_13715 [Paenibacillus spiritus]|uniref:Uncharacterized protein n=1 Tax=Paenibacillus spiritus TaxID=2496557 RepID=A0A5J5G599_9BACL|nr:MULTISPECIES: hypothetical protein [Paenibacillus]KAA9002112.1 hypothetical protein F4V43_13715 [Paenibacillus spiritus]